MKFIATSLRLLKKPAIVTALLIGGLILDESIGLPHLRVSMDPLHFLPLLPAVLVWKLLVNGERVALGKWFLIVFVPGLGGWLYRTKTGQPLPLAIGVPILTILLGLAIHEYLRSKSGRRKSER